MRKLAIFVIFALFPLASLASVSTLPNGNLIEVNKNTGIWKAFTLPTGLIFFAEIARADEPTLKEEIAMYAMHLADNWGLSQKKVLNIIDCESGFNPLAINPKDIDGHKKYGLLQWYLPTYRSLGGTDWKDWKENLEIGIPNMAKDGTGKWPVCSGSISYDELLAKFQ